MKDEDGAFTEKVLSQNNEWTYTWTDLPVKTADGKKEINYSITEADDSLDDGTYVSKYTVTTDATTKDGPTAAGIIADEQAPVIEFTNIHTPEVADISGTKTWDDQSDLFGDRPVDIKLVLHAGFENEDGEVAELDEPGYKTLSEGHDRDKVGEKLVLEQTLGSDNALASNADKWTYTWEKLPVYMPGQVGKKLTYWITEEAADKDEKSLSGYTLDPNTQEDDRVKDLKNKQKTTTLTAAKVWKDELELNASIASVTFKVQRSIGDTWTDVVTGTGDEAVTHTITLAQPENGWSSDATKPDTAVSIDKLPVTDANGNVYKYRAVEWYYTVDGVETPVYASNIPADNQNTSDDANAGQIGAYEYSEAVTTETEKADPDEKGGTITHYQTVVINDLITESIKATKTWDDDDNRDDIRPEDRNFILMVRTGDAEQSAAVEATAVTTVTQKSMSEEAEWAILPSYTLTGERYTYSVKELAAEGYTPSSVLNGADDAATGSLNEDYIVDVDTSKAENAIDLTNTHEPGVTTLTASKAWEMTADATTKPDVTLDLYRAEQKKDAATYGTSDADWEKVDSKTIRESDDWKAVWTDLPTFKTGEVGTRYHYKVVENVPTNFRFEVTEDTPEETLDGNDVNATNGDTKYAVTETITNTQKYVKVSTNKTFTKDNLDFYKNVESVTFKVQRKLETSENWVDVTSNGKTITYTATVKTTGAKEYSGTYDGKLSETDDDNNKYVYRSVEIGYTVAGKYEAAASDANAATDKAGAYTYTTGAEAFTENTDASIRAYSGMYSNGTTNELSTHALSIAKNVQTDSYANLSDPFTFTVTLTNEQGPTYPNPEGTYDVVYTTSYEENVVPADESVTFTAVAGSTTTATATITLKHGQQIEIKGLPEGVTFKVEESGTHGYQPETPTIEGDDEEHLMSDTSVKFQNNVPPMTWLFLHAGASPAETAALATLSMSLIALIILMYKKRNHRERRSE